MEISAVKALICPHCGEEFLAPRAGASSLACVQGHSFDIARQGYLNLLTGHGTKFVPDTAPMVAARDAFLDAGHYQPLGSALAHQVQELLSTREGEATVGSDSSGPALIVDAGTGTGYYLQQILAAVSAQTVEDSGQTVEDSGHGKTSHHGVERMQNISHEFGSARGLSAVGLDISKFALRRAAKRNPQAVNIVWDLWRDLPLGANTADVVLVIFAPRNSSEFARILKPGGFLVVVTPLPQHLAEIAHDAGLLGIQDDKESALNQSMASHFSVLGSHELLVPLLLSPADIANVALMGPAGHHLDPVELGARLDQRPGRSPATAAFRISVFRALPEHF